MKLIDLLKIFFLFMITPLFFAACSDDDENSTIDPSNLPVVAKEFIAEYLSSFEYLSVTRQKADENGRVFEAILSEGITIGFDQYGQWLKIERSGAGLPVNLIKGISGNIQLYIEENFSGQGIDIIEKKYYGYYVRLSAGNTAYAFDKNGNYLGIDKGGKDNMAFLPQNARDFLSAHFLASPKLCIIYDMEENTDIYKVYLEDGYFMHFNNEGNWILLSSVNYNREIPVSVREIFPAGLQQQLEQEYSGYKIVYVEKQALSYNLKLLKGYTQSEFTWTSNSGVQEN